MTTDNKITIENNTCIISSNLLDELDYVIGGYGQPTVEFIFNFNAFVEAYILSSNFIFTHREIEHINITRSVLFPNGRLNPKTFPFLVVLETTSCSAYMLIKLKKAIMKQP